MVSKRLPCRKQNLTTKELGGEVMIYHEDHDTVHVLNETAALIWSLLDGRHTIDDLQCEVRKKFFVEDERDISGDVERAVKELRRQGLLEEGT